MFRSGAINPTTPPRERHSGSHHDFVLPGQTADCRSRAPRCLRFDSLTEQEVKGPEWDKRVPES